MKSIQTSACLAAVIALSSSWAIPQISPPELTGTWTRLGPYGGSIMGIAQSPANSDVLFAMTNYNPFRFFKSENHGASWTEQHNFENQYIYCWAMAPTNANVLYAGGWGIFSNSTNAGIDWQRKSFNDINFRKLLVDSKDSRRIYAYGEFYEGSDWIDALLVSENAGTSWSHAPIPSDLITYVYSFAVDPLHPDTVYFCGYNYTGTYQPTVLRTMDGGGTWSSVGTGVSGYYVYDILVDPVETNKVYCCTSIGVFRSSDWGSTFLANQDWVYGYTITIDPNNRNTLYTGYSKRIFKSTNGGINWQTYTQGLAGGLPSDILVDRSSSNSIFLSNSVGVFASSDGGVNWNESNDGIYASQIPSLKVSPASGNTLVINIYGDAVYRTNNAMGKTLAGQTVSWERLPDFYACDDISDFEFDALDPNILWALEGGA